MFKKTIGILGGSGPIATASFYQKLINRAHKQYGCNNDMDYPRILLANAPIENVTHKGIPLYVSTKDLLKVSEPIVDGLEKLRDAGSDILLMYCNSFHVFHHHVSACMGITVFNMVEETVLEAKKQDVKSVAVLCSESSSQFGVYTNYLRHHKINQIHLRDDEQDKVTSLIYRAMGCDGDYDLNNEFSNLVPLLLELNDRGADTIIVGCSELSMLPFPKTRHINFIDSTDVAISRLLEIAK